LLPFVCGNIIFLGCQKTFFFFFVHKVTKYFLYLQWKTIFINIKSWEERVCFGIFCPLKGKLQNEHDKISVK